MLKIENSNFNFSGVSMEAEERIVSFSASGSQGSMPYFSYNIENRELYNQHITNVDADFVAFKAQVLEALDTIKA